MAYFIEVDSYEHKQKIIVNLENIVQVLPTNHGSLIYLTENKILSVRDNYDYFKQYCMVPVTSNNISEKVKNLGPIKKEIIEIPSLADKKIEAPKAPKPEKAGTTTEGI